MTIHSVAKNVLYVIVALGLLDACSDGPGALNALEAAGYKSVEITGYAVFGCGGGDFYHTAFNAIGQNGKAVTGVVCAGGGLFGKASTIRTFS